MLSFSIAGKTMTTQKFKEQRNVFFNSGAGDAVRVAASFFCP